ncbi:MAG: GAF domain-containing protein [Parachlamydiales bacterium]|jgi:hypothetical protein
MKIENEYENLPSLSQKPFIQALICALSLALIHYVLGGGALFLPLILYGFWFLSCIIASLYGTVVGLFCSILCSAIYLLFHVFDPNIPLGALLQFRPYEQPLLWIFSAIVFGEIRSQLNLTMLQMQDHLSLLSDSNQMLQDNVAEVQRENNKFKHLLVSSSEKNEETINVLLPLLALKSTQVLLNVENAIHTILSPKKFSIYANGNDGLEILISHGWSAMDAFPLRIVPDDLLYKSVVIHREAVAATDIPIDFLEKHGVFAAPFSDPETGEVYGMIKIEEMGAKPLDQSSVEIAKELCRFIGQVYALARHYQDAMKSSIYSRQGYIYSDAMHQCLHEYLLMLAKKLGFSLSSFHIVLRSASENVFLSELRIVSEIIARILPSQALIFQGKGPSYELSVLLPGCLPRQVETYEVALTKALHEQGSLKTSKVYVTRKTEYVLEVALMNS